MTIEKFLQQIVCMRCKQLLGYAPYWRTDYLCVQCNGPVTDEDFVEEGEEE